MIGRLSTRDRRTVALGAAVIVALVFLSRGLPALREWHNESVAEAKELTTEEHRAESSVRNEAVVRDSQSRRGARYLALAPRLVAGSTPSAAAGTLASFVSGSATLAGVRMGAVTVRHDSTKGGTFTRIVVRASGTGDVRGVTALLRTLESGPVLLRVRELSVTQPEPAAGNDRPESLRLELVVEGLALASQTRADASSRSSPRPPRDSPILRNDGPPGGSR